VLAAIVARGFRLGAAQYATILTPTIAAAAVAYLAGHAVRAVRLSVLVGREAPLKRLITLHGLTAGLSMILPWKLSEAVRVGELAANLQSLPRALATVWIERAFDFAAAMALLALASAMGLAAHAEVRPLALLWAIFVIASLFVFWVLPENLRQLKLMVLVRYRGAVATRLLQTLNGAEAISRAGNSIVRAHPASLAMLTLAIWVCELTALMLATGGGVTEAIPGLLDVLSAAPGGAIFAATDFAVELNAAGAAGASALRAYQTAIVLPTLALGAACGGAYLALARLARRKRELETPLMLRGIG